MIYLKKIVQVQLCSFFKWNEADHFFDDSLVYWFSDWNLVLEFLDQSFQADFFLGSGLHVFKGEFARLHLITSN
ncbi:hypothetical protein B0I27_103406 [Arcticibacter pallidicorallinus]|uniref:Uncharacterized protein n=1 Tax=Arcticibacter pallidicorallinus TaxID=1259464 RepID=A0A2T0U7P1_9SPHI|nr:hypothetical protein B0I27_103406 [Arcticibacter pallidicorallinus]